MEGGTIQRKNPLAGVHSFKPILKIGAFEID
jgi:hypothetical protein